jgi:hypothetical protein
MVDRLLREIAAARHPTNAQRRLRVVEQLEHVLRKTRERQPSARGTESP